MNFKRVLTRVATAATEGSLLMIALHGTAHHVEKVVRLFRRAQEAAELSREAQQQAGRSVHYFYDTDGSLVSPGGLSLQGLRIELNARDPECCFPGCTHQRYLDAHHVAHWVDGGETKLGNLVQLCRTHHRLVHEGGIRVAARAGGGWRFARPDGREFDQLPDRDPAAPPPEWTALRDTHAELGIKIDSNTAATRWRGERMDYELGVWILCRQHEREQRAGLEDQLDPASNVAGNVSAATREGSAKHA
jgi:hypothetical protein